MKRRGPSKGRPIAVEVFSGSGRWSRAMAAVGFEVRAWDIKNGPDYDVTVAKNWTRLLQDIAVADVVHLGTPCESFSTARRGKLGSPGGPMRSKECPMGLPNLLPKDAAKVALGNKLLGLSLRIVRRCCQQRVPVSLENPRRSRIWWTPSMLGALRRHGHKVCVDYCQFGLPWQKATVFAVWNCPALLSLERTCRPDGHLCSRSWKPHKRLEGNAAGGARWTQIAEPYPWELVANYASLVANVVQAAPTPVRLRGLVSPSGQRALGAGPLCRSGCDDAGIQSASAGSVS